MRNADTETIDALFGAKDRGIAPRQFIYFKLVDGTEFGFHNDIEPAFDVEVIDGTTGNPVTHTYYGDGSIQRVGAISLTTGLTVRRVTLELMTNHDVVELMLKGHSVRNALVEIHRGLLDTSTGELVSRPVPHFIGTVNTAPQTRGSTGAATIECTSIVNQLTRTNPAKASDAHQRTRINDRLYQYVDIQSEIKVQWGGKQ